MNSLPEGIVIRDIMQGDEARVREFFAQMGEESVYFFNRGACSELRVMRFFEPGGAPDMATFFAVERAPGASQGQEGAGGFIGGERIAGCLFLWDADTSVPWLGIAVRDEYKGMGLGTRLMAHARAYVARHGKGGILLTTAKHNFRGQALYEKSGYESIGIAQNGELLYLLRDL